MVAYYAKTAEEQTYETMFYGTKKFVENEYARCGNRFYKVVRLTPDGFPILRLFGRVCVLSNFPSIKYEFQHAKRPKGRYPKDIDGSKDTKNYIPCKRGRWWQSGVVTLKV